MPVQSASRSERMCRKDLMSFWKGSEPWLPMNSFRRCRSCRMQKSRILRGIDLLSERAAHLVIVSDEVNRAGFDYEGDTMRYLQLVGEINQELGHLADRVVEMVCGIPVERKSGTEITYEILKLETRDRSRLQMA